MIVLKLILKLHLNSFSFFLSQFSFGGIVSDPRFFDILTKF